MNVTVPAGTRNRDVSSLPEPNDDSPHISGVSVHAMRPT
jgi:hypothetical protein